MKNVYAEESHNAEYDEIQHFCLKPNKICYQKIVIFAVYKVKCKYLYKFTFEETWSSIRDVQINFCAQDVLNAEN